MIAQSEFLRPDRGLVVGDGRLAVDDHWLLAMVQAVVSHAANEELREAPLAIAQGLPLLLVSA
jgi:hypothetical protein